MAALLLWVLFSRVVQVPKLSLHPLLAEVPSALQHDSVICELFNVTKLVRTFYKIKGHFLIHILDVDISTKCHQNFAGVKVTSLCVINHVQYSFIMLPPFTAKLMPF